MLWFPVWAGGELGYTEKSLFNSLWGQSTPWSCGPVASAVNTYGHRTLSKRREKKNGPRLVMQKVLTKAGAKCIPVPWIIDP